MNDVLRVVKSCGSLNYTRQQANACRDRAQKHLENLPASVARDALAALAAIAVERTT